MKLSAELLKVAKSCCLHSGHHGGTELAPSLVVAKYLRDQPGAADEYGTWGRLVELHDQGSLTSDRLCDIVMHAYDGAGQQPRPPEPPPLAATLAALGDDAAQVAALAGVSADRLHRILAGALPTPTESTAIRRHLPANDRAGT